MSKIESTIRDIRSLDALADADTAIHRLDPRAKVTACLLFMAIAVSFPKYDINGLMPLFAYPILIASIGRVPFMIVLRYILLASPFAVFVGIFNPIIDNETLLQLGNMEISGGWISFISIILKFILTVSAAVILTATTGYIAICNALERMGLPRILVVQFLFLFRFIFILADEASRMSRAYTLRSCSNKGAPVQVWSSLAGHLLLRAYDRGQRIYTAMLSRGFNGNIRTLKNRTWSKKDTGFMLLCVAFILPIRFLNITEQIGSFAIKGLT